MSILAAFIAAHDSSSPLAASNNGPVSGVGTGTVNTLVVTITATGGAPPYSYSAAYQSGDTVTILNGTTSTPSFRRSGVVLFDVFVGIVRVTVTDAASRTATTDVEWTIIGEGDES